MADVEKIRGSYKRGNLKIIELDPKAVPPEGYSDERVAMQGWAAEINRLGITSWQRKFSEYGVLKRQLMSPQAVQDFWGSSEQQLERILKPTRAARYLIALETRPENEAVAVGFTRVESYNPVGRLAKAVSAASRTKYPYPNVTDLELNRHYNYGDAAVALLYHALDTDEINPTHKVSAYVEEPDNFGGPFYRIHGFEERDRKRDEVLPFEFIHLEAPSIEYVLDGLRGSYLFLNQQQGQ